MTDVRIPAPTSKWYIPKQAFLTAKHFAYQYQEWKDELSTLETGLGSPNFNGMPHGNYLSNPTAEIAERRAELDEKIKLVEQTAREVAPDMYRWLLKAVTAEGTTYTYLRNVMGIPCGINRFTDIRRHFYYELSKKI